METVRYEIPEYRLDAFKAVVAKAAKKAAKLGVEAFAVAEAGVEARVLERTQVGDEVVFVLKNPAEVRMDALFDGAEAPRGVTRTTVNVVLVDVTGPEPVLEGWRFVAAIDHDPDGNVVRQVPGDSNPVQVSDWVAAAPDCEHCKLARSRRETYLLVHETGTLIQVGSTCIRDFLGGVTADAMAKLAETWMVVSLAASDEDWGWGGGSGPEGWRRDEVMAQ